MLTTCADNLTLWLSPVHQQGRLAWWLWPGYRIFLEVASMVVTWWILAFLPSVVWCTGSWYLWFQPDLGVRLKDYPPRFDLIRVQTHAQNISWLLDYLSTEMLVNHWTIRVIRQSISGQSLSKMSVPRTRTGCWGNTHPGGASPHDNVSEYLSVVLSSLLTFARQRKDVISAINKLGQKRAVRSSGCDELIHRVV